MPLPKIDGPNLKKPLCYDPSRGKFIYYDEIVSGKEKIIPVETLSADDFKRLAIERLRSGPDFRGGPMSGPMLDRDGTIKAIEAGDKFGRQVLEGEKSMLIDLLNNIQRNL